ncbi:hypothetical protein COOONC_11517 [Cooperia oncophora]
MDLMLMVVLTVDHFYSIRHVLDGRRNGNTFKWSQHALCWDFGTWQAKDEHDLMISLRTALDNGYRLIGETLHSSIKMKQ